VTAKYNFGAVMLAVIEGMPQSRNASPGLGRICV
jgi:hypothetical protein